MKESELIRQGQLTDIEKLVHLENSCFDYDRISRRSFRYFLTKSRAVLLVEEVKGEILAYILLLFHRGTSLARLYSIAVNSASRQHGVAKKLVAAGETAAVDRDCITIRLEVRDDNIPSIRLFESLGYQKFGRYLNYYEDDSDAIRLEKRLLKNLPAQLTTVPYYQQTLDFTCGPASLMMAMKALDSTVKPSRRFELRLWRESTTIYMTSGHGGCGPYGLALAAHHRDFQVIVYVKDRETFFIDSVRNEDKKEVIRLVEEEFLEEINLAGIVIHHQQVTTKEIVKALDDGAIPVVLISSYRLYKEKSPHWVVITGHDEHLLYFHDPYINKTKGRTVTDCVNMPIPLQEFERMAQYGKSGQRAALIIYRKSCS